MSPRPSSFRRSYAIDCPSGDHVAVPPWPPLNDVSCRALRPSRSATQTSCVPDRWLSNAIRVPSGEKRAFRSDRVDPIRLTGLPADWP